MTTILISGAGIAGLSLARQLKKHNIAYTLIEKKSQLDATGTGIALPANAVRALRYMGLSTVVDKLHQVKDIIYARPNGRIISQASLLNSPLNRDKFVALDRADLLTILRQDVEDDIHFNVTVTRIKQDESGVDVEFSNPLLNGHYQAIVGADGIYSTVRELGFGASELEDLGVTNWRWISEYPAKELQPTYMIGKDNMFLAYPIGPNRIYCYAHQADKTGHYQSPDAAQENLRQVFAKYKAIAAPLLQQLSSDTRVYTGRLRSVPIPLFSRENIALIGDASNACSPMLQQGAACAFEDAIILAELLANFPVKEALENYEAQRYQRVNWILRTSDDSIKSFINMNSRLSILARNLFIRYKGPLNVLGWKHLLSYCPLDTLATFINETTASKEPS
ncbi:MAG: FAD-dependent monooxygenase [Legionella sp.]|nr:FAD-dependent monooxygenase [Legionella sp.]